MAVQNIRGLQKGPYLYFAEAALKQQQRLYVYQLVLI